MGQRVLFVCLGNICRSPTAEGVLRALVAARESPSLPVEVDSAGTSNYHPGAPPDRRSVAFAAERGYDLSALRARQVRPSDFAEFDLLLAMDKSNLDELRGMAPAGGASVARCHLFLEYAGHPTATEVPDPYYDGPEAFARVLDLAEEGGRLLLTRLEREGLGRRG